MVNRRSHYRILEHFRAQRLRLRLETGRTHQIRVHMAQYSSAGGRSVWWPSASAKGASSFISTLRKFDRQALLQPCRLYHPISGIEMEWHAYSTRYGGAD